MEIRHFRYFLSVAQHGHFTRAAEQLGIAPPTLSRQIQDMENELGVRLFQRSQRAVRLTAAGEALRVEALQAVRQFDAAQLGAQRAGRGDVGRIELGYVASAAYSGLLQQQVTHFSQSCPGVQLNIREVAMMASPELVRDGQLDLAYVRMPMELPEELNAITLLEEGFVLALPSSSRLNELPQINAARLAGETFILPEQISGTLAVAAQEASPRTWGRSPAAWWRWSLWSRWARASRWCRSRWCAGSICRRSTIARSKIASRAPAWPCCIAVSKRRQRCSAISRCWGACARLCSALPGSPA